MREFEARKEPVNLSCGFPALTGDIIMDYFFGFNQGQLKSPQFASFHEAFKNMGVTGHVASQWPFILPMMNMIPDKVLEWLQPDAKPLIDFRRVRSLLAVLSTLADCSTLAKLGAHCPNTARYRH